MWHQHLLCWRARGKLTGHGNRFVAPRACSNTSLREESDGEGIPQARKPVLSKRHRQEHARHDVGGVANAQIAEASLPEIIEACANVARSLAIKHHVITCRHRLPSLLEIMYAQVCAYHERMLPSVHERMHNVNISMRTEIWTYRRYRRYTHVHRSVDRRTDR